MFQKFINILNNMKPKQLLILAGIAFLLMFVTIIAGLNYVASKNAPVVVQEQPKPVEEKISVVVAKVNIPPGTRIQEQMLQMKEVPKDVVPGDAIKNFDELKDLQIKVPIFAGDVITGSKVAAQPVDEGFASTIPPNCRAVSINVNDVTGVAGFAKAGDHVDLLLVEKGKNSVTTNLLLQNVPLLSVNQDRGGAYSVNENGVPNAPVSNPTIATFALLPEDAIKLVAASKLGEIYMSLRPNRPQVVYTEPIEYTIESVDAPKREPARETPPAIQSTPVPPIPSVAPIPSTPPTPKIEIIAGDQIVQSSAPSTPPTRTPTAAPPSTPTTNQPLPVIPSTSPPIVQPEN